MSRIAKQPILIPSGVDVKLQGSHLVAKGAVGEMSMDIHHDVEVEHIDNQLQVLFEKTYNAAMAGTMRSLMNNLIIGVSKGFEKKLELVGVGYRAQLKGKILSLALGYSHPVNYPVPQGISIETPSQTEVVIKGVDKQKVGQVAAEIRTYRLPEPYKGKGIKYAEEKILRKEAKKK